MSDTTPMPMPRSTAIQMASRPLQIREPNRFPLGPWVVDVNEYDDRVPAVRLCVEPRVVLDMGEDRDIRPEQQEAFEHLFRVADHDGEGQVWVALAERRQHLRHMVDVSEYVVCLRDWRRLRVVRAFLDIAQALAPAGSSG